MGIFKSKMGNRLTISKSLGFIVGLIGFFVLPYIFPAADIYLRLAILFWYTTFGSIIGIFGVINVHPVLSWFKMPWYFRGIFMGGWLNFVIALFMYHSLGDLMIGTAFEGMSPFWLIAEGMIVGLIIDFAATKCAGDGKELCK